MSKAKKKMSSLFKLEKMLLRDFFLKRAKRCFWEDLTDHDSKWEWQKKSERKKSQKFTYALRTHTHMWVPSLAQSHICNSVKEREKMRKSEREKPRERGGRGRERDFPVDSSVWFMPRVVWKKNLQKIPRMEHVISLCQTKHLQLYFNGEVV
jgi:hypothetical protein